MLLVAHDVDFTIFRLLKKQRQLKNEYENEKSRSNLTYVLFFRIICPFIVKRDASFPGQIEITSTILTTVEMRK